MVIKDIALTTIPTKAFKWFIYQKTCYNKDK